MTRKFDEKESFIFRVLASSFDDDDIEQLDRLKSFYAGLAIVLLGMGVYLLFQGNNSGWWMVLVAVPLVVLYWVVRQIYKEKSDVEAARKKLGYD